MHHGDAIGHGERFFLVVGDEQESDADAALQAFSSARICLRRFGSSAESGSSSSSTSGSQDERTREGDALLFAAG